MTYAISLSGTTVSIASPGPRGIGVPSGGTTGQVLKKASDTNYDFAWDAPISGIANIVEDTTPQLGGPLDVNGNAIVSTSNANIAITPNGTGQVQFNGYYLWPTQASDGTNGQVLKTNGSGTLSFGDASVVATTLDLTDTPGSYGTAGQVLALNSGATGFEFVANVGSGAIDCAVESDVAEGSITDVVALTAAQYADISGGADPNTLYVITDGTTSIADSDDVTITGTPSDHSFLVYDSATSDWINRTAAEAQADLGISTFGTTLIDDADATAARTTLGLGTAATSASSDFVASSAASVFGLTLLDDADAAAARTTLGLGTLATASTITDSYLMLVESPSDKTYTLDARVPAARTVTNFYARTASGTCTATLKNLTDATTIGTISVTSTGGSAASLTNTGLTANERIAIEISSNSSGADLEMVVEFTQ